MALWHIALAFLAPALSLVVFIFSLKKAGMRVDPLDNLFVTISIGVCYAALPAFVALAVLGL